MNSKLNEKNATFCGRFGFVRNDVEEIEKIEKEAKNDLKIKCPKCSQATALRHGLQPHCVDCDIVSLNYNVRTGTASDWQLLDAYLDDCADLQNEIDSGFDNQFFN